MSDLENRVTHLESLLELTNRALIQAKYAALDKLYERTLAGRPLTCLLCGYQAVRETFETRTSQCRFGGGHLERYNCSHCGGLFGPMKILDMAQSELDDEYRLLYGSYQEGDSTEAELRTFASLNPREGNLYLNWGCGGRWSKSIERLRALGWDVWGFEPFAETSGNYVVRFRGEVSASFDGIFSHNVIEHFRDPIAQFRDFASVLKQGGLMAHSTPCYEYRCHDTRFHTVFYLGESIRLLAEETGFDILTRETDGEYINTVFQKRATA